MRAAEVEALRRAYRRRGRMLVAQRWALADRVADLRADIAELKEEVARLEREVADRAAQVERLLGSKTFRYTRGLRSLYGKLRRGR